MRIADQQDDRQVNRAVAHRAGPGINGCLAISSGTGGFCNPVHLAASGSASCGREGCRADRVTIEGPDAASEGGAWTHGEPSKRRHPRG